MKHKRTFRNKSRICRNLFQMPRVGPPEFYAGVIRALTAEVQSIAKQLESPVELSHETVRFMEGRLNENQSSYDTHMKLLPKEEGKEIRQSYRQARKRALQALVNRYAAAINAIEPGAGDNQAMQFGGAPSMEAMAAAANVEQHPDAADELIIYASGHEEEMPIACMSMLTQSANYQPITFGDENRDPKRPNPFAKRRSQTSLTSNEDGSVNHKRSNVMSSVGSPGERRNQEGSDQANRRRDQRPEESWGDQWYRKQMEWEATPAPLPIYGRLPTTRGIAPNVQLVQATVRDRYGRLPYVWLQQPQINGPMTGVPFPPMRYSRPLEVVLERNNPNIIGMAEIWIQIVGNREPTNCAQCQFQSPHRLYKCPAFERMGLQERWYRVLKMGVCLNCLIIGHSSFSCKSRGTCPHHGQRHSSHLCSESFRNQQN